MYLCYTEWTVDISDYVIIDAAGNTEVHLLNSDFIAQDKVIFNHVGNYLLLVQNIISKHCWIKYNTGSKETNYLFLALKHIFFSFCLLAQLNHQISQF